MYHEWVYSNNDRKKCLRLVLNLLIFRFGSPKKLMTPPIDCLKNEWPPHMHSLKTGDAPLYSATPRPLLKFMNWPLVCKARSVEYHAVTISQYDCMARLAYAYGISMSMGLGMQAGVDSASGVETFWSTYCRPTDFQVEPDIWCETNNLLQELFHGHSI